MVNKLRADSSATYRICVQGDLDQEWSDWLGGLDIRAQELTNDAAVTILYGRILDQAQLLGVLNILHDLRLPLISVEYQNFDEPLL